MRVLQKISQYGEDLTLFCPVEKCCYNTAGWEIWDPLLRTIFDDVRNVSLSKDFKYTAAVKNDGYNLTIRHIEPQDINKTYSCLYGVTRSEKIILTEENVFKSKFELNKELYLKIKRQTE